MTTTVEKYRLLVERLYTRTINKKLSWERDDDETLNYFISDKTVELSYGENFEEETIIIIKIYKNGDVIEKFDDETLKGPKPRVGGFESYWSLLANLFDTAKRQATGADDALDSLLDELDDNTE